MSATEVAWRTRSLLRDEIDRLLVSRRQRPRKFDSLLIGGEFGEHGFRVSDLPIGWGASLQADSPERQWYDALLTRADAIAAGRLSFFDLKDCFLGDPIDWNRDHKRDQASPMTFSGSIDYRDVAVAGDCKFVWEPNRCHHLVVLARAYRASGEIRYAEAVAKQLDSWLSSNPYGVGMNWRSGLELGIRLINWVWAIDLIDGSGQIKGELQRRLMDSIARHIWEIDRKYSRGSSVNNHLIGEAAGVFVATCYYPYLWHASRWRARSRDILCREILRQTYDSGATVEQAAGYHIFVLQLFLVAGLAARGSKCYLPTEYWSRLEKMFEFIGLLGEGGDALPAFGDADDGYVLDLGYNGLDFRQWLAVGAVLFERGDFKAWAGEFAEPACWLLGKSARRQFDAIDPPQTETIASSELPDSGYYLLQHGRRDSVDRISVIFDCGRLGMPPLAAHGHADALSFTIRAFGQDVLVDPGTYDYFSRPNWREYFRSTRAHNTIVIDGRDQSEMLGPFLWGRRATARRLDWRPGEQISKVAGEHDGYACLADPVIHRRSLELDAPSRSLIVQDEIIASGEHEARVYFHFAEHCTVTPAGDNRYTIDTGAGSVTLQLDERLDVKAIRGCMEPICGWVSRGYHRKQPSTTLVGRCACHGNTTLVCRFDIGCASRTESVSHAAVSCEHD